ncbi:hypothetical protein [Orenia marismortui]|uniref:Uncharacterized protein n=1 Tax=Orenia marismortui TaxID=46469 RepID=A0A4R8H897_9FIRM|nr:hypothetical protein [Orenia marismortui]TDX51387.1 hypothetical protein C7959_11332 [Orenia marismortui]
MIALSKLVGTGNFYGDRLDYHQDAKQYGDFRLRAESAHDSFGQMIQPAI